MTTGQSAHSSIKFEEPPFIVRETQLVQLKSGFRRAASGKPQLVVVKAKSGRGKSRLLVEFEASLGSGVVILQGKGVAQTAQRPFQSFVGVAKGIIELCEQEPQFKARLVSAIGDQQAALLAVLPEFTDIFGSSLSSEVGPENFGEDRSLRALSRLLTALATVSYPIVVMLDDCQWADELTLKLLNNWGLIVQKQGTDKLSLLVVAAYRSDEVDGSHLLSTLQITDQVVLEDFSEEEITLLIRSMAGDVASDVIKFALKLCGGSPFMALAVIRGLAEKGVIHRVEKTWQFNTEMELEDLDSSSQAPAFLRRRFEILKTEVVQFFKVAAILGKQFEMNLTAVVAGTSVDEAREFIKDGIYRAILKETGDGESYEFAHDKLREALLEMLSDEEQKFFSLHTALTIRELHPDRIFELAYFFASAGDYERALPYATNAAKEARARCALKIAEEQYDIALKGLKQSNRQGRYLVFQGLGEVLMLQGKYEAALAAFSQAKDVSSSQQESAQIETREAEILFKMGDTFGAAQRLIEALRRLGVYVPINHCAVLLSVALQLTIQILHSLLPWVFIGRRSKKHAGNDLLISQMLNQLSYVYWFEDCSVYIAFWPHLRAMNLIEQYPITPELTHAYSSHSMGMAVVGAFRRGRSYGKKAIKMAIELQNAWCHGQSLNFYGCTVLAACRHAECIEYCGEAARLLERTGDLWELNIANCNVAYGLYRSGNLKEAASLGESCYWESMAAHDLISAASSLSVWSKASFGAIPQAEVERLKLLLTSSAFQPSIELAQAEGISHAVSGRLVDALEVFERAFQWTCRTIKFQEYVTPLLMWYVTMLRRRLEELNEEGALRKQVKKRIRRVVMLALPLAYIFPNNLAHIWRELALLVLINGRPGYARYCVERSISAARRIGCRHEYVQSLFVLSRIGAALNLKNAMAQRFEAQQLAEEFGENSLFWVSD